MPFSRKAYILYTHFYSTLSGIMGQGRAEVMRYFKDYMEDFNTATMPHDKFYHYERWEMAEYHRKKTYESTGKGASSSNPQGAYDAVSDEANRRAELKRRKEDDEKKEVSIPPLQTKRNDN